MATFDDVRAIVAALPGATEVFVPSWGHPTFRVNDKMFATGSSVSPTISLKASKEDQAELVASAPETYKVAAYTGRYGWVEVDLARVDPDELRELVVEAWRRTAPKKLLREYEGS